MIQACLHSKGLLGQKSSQIPLSFYDSPHLLCHQNNSRSFSLADFFRQKKNMPHFLCPQTFWTHCCSSTSLSGPWQQLSNSSSSGHIVWSRRPRFPFEHSHYLKALPSTIGLRSWTKSHSFLQENLLSIFQLIFLTPFLYSRWIMA